MAKIIQSIKIRIYPNNQQAEYFSTIFGCCRFVYNKCLEYKQNVFNKTGKHATWAQCGKFLTKLRNTKKYAWLRDAPQESQSRELLNLENAYSNYYNGSGLPKFKNKKDKDTFHFSKRGFTRNGICGNRISLGRWLKGIKYKCSRRDEITLNQYQDSIITGVVEKTKYGAYFVSICLESPNLTNYKISDKIIGVDIGIKDFVVTSDGERFGNIKTIRNNEKKLKKLQRQHSKKQKGSKNKEKARLKLARFHNKIHNYKENYLHKVANKLLNDNQVIVLETLDLKSMAKNHKMAKSIMELSAYRFKVILKYKAVRNERDIIEIGQYFPSSKLCECCGFKNDALTLKDRTWVCPSCGVEHDRDLNAARNIRNEGIRLLREKLKNDSLKLSKLGLSSPDVKLVEHGTDHCNETRKECNSTKC